MKQITFTITKEEVRKYSKEILSDKQMNEILEIIENDNILWKNIEKSISAAIEIVQTSELKLFANYIILFASGNITQRK